MNPFLIAYLFGAVCTLAYSMRKFLELWNQGSINVDVPGKWFQLQMGWVMFSQLVGSSVVWPLHIFTFALGWWVKKNAAPNDVATLGVTQTFDKDGGEIPPEVVKRPEGLPPNEVLVAQLAALREELNRTMPAACADKHEIAIAQAFGEAAWVQMAAFFQTEDEARTRFLRMAEYISNGSYFKLGPEKET